jgi:hypothetical protein
VGAGRFWSMDSCEGMNSDPAGLHKYLYADVDPISHIDPSGRITVMEELVAQAIDKTMNLIARVNVAFATSAAAGYAAISRLGAYVESAVEEISESNGATIVQSAVRFGPRSIDFLIKIKDRLLYLEVKSTIPNGGEAFGRLVAQIETMVANAPPGAQTAVFAADADEIALARVYASLSEAATNQVTFIVGYNNLVTYLQSLNY